MTDNRPYIELEFTGQTLTQYQYQSNTLIGSDIVIDYGDGNTVNYNGDYSHTYGESGTYTIRIYGVTSLGTNCFRAHDEITSVIIPNSVTSLGNTCFYSCDGLTSIVIPDSVTSLGNNCFSECTGLTSIVIPDSVTSIGEHCFTGCYGLTDMQFNWTSSNDILAYDSGWIPSGSSVVFSIPYGTTSLYEDKGYPTSKLVEQSLKTYQSLSINGKTVKNIYIGAKEIKTITRIPDGQILYQKPTPTPIDNYELTLASDKSILSYEDNETATITATLTNNGTPVTGETVTFKAYKNDTLVETIGTDTTDNNGEATVGYVSKGTGDLNIKCEVVDRMLVSETYIEDCQYYRTTQYKENTYGIPLNMPLPSTFKLELDITPTSRSTSNWGSSGYIKTGTDSNNGVWIGQLTSAGRHGLMPKPSGTTQYCTSNTVLNSDNHVTVIFDGTTVTYTCNNETVSVSASNLSKIVEVAPTSNVGIKNIKIKPL